MRNRPSGYYASDGAAYYRFLGRWTERLAVPFADFARLPGDGAVLDVGCGTGSRAAEIARRGSDGQVVGVDVSDPYLAFARTRHATANLHFKRCDAADLTFASGRFAASLAQLVLTFVPDPRRVVAEMARVTRPGGVLAAAVWDFCGGLVYQRLFWDTAAVIDLSAGRARDRLFAHPLSEPGGLHAPWSSAGFAEVEAASLTIRMDFEGFEDYWDPLLGGQGPVGTYVTGLDSEQRDRLRAAVRDAFSLRAAGRTTLAGGHGVGDQGHRRLIVPQAGLLGRTCDLAMYNEIYRELHQQKCRRVS